MSEKRETQWTISAWATETFGPASSHARVAARANEEMAELLRGFTSSADIGKLLEEAADVVIVLYRLADRLGMDLDQAAAGVGVSDTHTETLIGQANESMARLLRQLLAGWDGSDARGELACVVAQLKAFVQAWGGDLAAIVDAKMAVNRARQWKLDSHGHGYHVREKAEATQ